jgi:hypothetical protein
MGSSFNMHITHLSEPELEFGTGNHIDMRFGVMNYGPVDMDTDDAPKSIRLGIVGMPETVEDFQLWLERCRRGIEAKASNKPNLFPRFPGCSLETGFRTELQSAPALARTFTKEEIGDAASAKSAAVRTIQMVELFVREIRYLTQNHRVDVIVCAPSVQILRAMDTSADCGKVNLKDRVDFHDCLKARAMQFKKPLQVVLPPTYGSGGADEGIEVLSRRSLQDEATRAWNIHCALYYKARGYPWRLMRRSDDLTVCFVGISFYEALSRDRLLTSVAQVFNERGEGVVVRGGDAAISKDDRQPHLSQPDAEALLEKALRRYKEVHKTLPARIVIHKTSAFSSGEECGFIDVLRDARIDCFDLLYLSQATTRLFRIGKYPPLRGTLATLSRDRFVLYCRGSIQFFETYPGLYTPSPLHVHCHASSDTHRSLGRELLALTKMNWNNTQFDGLDPITIRAARQVGSVLRYCNDDLENIEPSYSYYM